MPSSEQLDQWYRNLPDDEREQLLTLIPVLISRENYREAWCWMQDHHPEWETRSFDEVHEDECQGGDVIFHFEEKYRDLAMLFKLRWGGT